MHLTKPFARWQFSGTGGVGNIRRSSVSSDSRPFDGPDDYDLTHGRELAVYPDRVLHIFCFRILARMALL
jgi:hypothetical protein